ncbi:hypothetical protein HanPSC8_Chr02g0054791 [Helianthus annuus]|nr:hypothetical protein HanPSC8_Chr02g0054791 [Helianthus annuus]
MSIDDPKTSGRATASSHASSMSNWVWLTHNDVLSFYNCHFSPRGLSKFAILVQIVFFFASGSLTSPFCC